MAYDIRHGDCRELLKTIPDQSIDAVITDPPYPGIRREYGRWDEDQWRELMDPVVTECRRVLKPSGSAVFVLQPNYRKVGSTALWLWRWLVDVAESWNFVQPVYWWNNAALPMAGCSRKHGLCRNSVKYCLWFGPADCYRNQDAVLIPRHEASAKKLADDRVHYTASGRAMNNARCYGTALERGGATPFNLLPMPNTDGRNSAGARWGHGAGTPVRLADWWIRYIVPPGGVVLDPFAGVASIGVPALRRGCDYIGFEAMAEYAEKARMRLSEVVPK